MGTSDGIPQKIRYHCRVCKKEVRIEYVRSVHLGSKLFDGNIYKNFYLVFFRIPKHKKSFLVNCETSGRILKRKMSVYHDQGHIYYSFLRKRDKKSRLGKNKTQYLIEFRFHGKAKFEIKKSIHEIKRNFNLKPKRVVPHITLVGSFYTNKESRLIGDFNRLCSKSPLMTFEIDGFSTFKNSRTVFLDVKPSKELDDFRWNLSQTIEPYCKLSQFDYEREFAFHSTLAMKLTDEKFHKIADYVKRKPKLNFKHWMVRATLLRGGIIRREYDFLLRRPLTRRLAKNKEIYAKTLDLLKQQFEKD